MNSGVEQNQVESREPVAALAGPQVNPEAELDLDRIVWDPEYRNSVRHLFKTGG